MNHTPVFWKIGDLSGEQSELLDELMTAHHECVRRGNVSTHAVVGAAVGSGDYMKAIACGMLSIGHLHAPLAQCMELLSHSPVELAVSTALDAGKKIPGWGSSFGKDEIFSPVESIILRLAPEIHERIGAVTKLLHERGKIIHPNPGCYTAAVALILEMPPAVAPWLFLMGRLDGWSKLFLENHNPEALWAS